MIELPTTPEEILELAKEYGQDDDDSERIDLIQDLVDTGSYRLLVYPDHDAEAWHVYIAPVDDGEELSVGIVESD